MAGSHVSISSDCKLFGGGKTSSFATFFGIGRYMQYVKNEIAKRPKDAKLGGQPGAFPTIRAFVAIRAQDGVWGNSLEVGLHSLMLFGGDLLLIRIPRSLSTEGSSGRTFTIS